MYFSVVFFQLVLKIAVNIFSVSVVLAVLACLFLLCVKVGEIHFVVRMTLIQKY